MTGNNTVSSKQMALFTFVTQTAVGIITLPALLAKEVGHDGWISVLITGAIAIVLGALIVLLLRRYSDKAIYDINKYIFGKIIGTIFNILLVVYLLMATIGGLRLFGVFIRLVLLPRTPPLALAPFMILPTFYLVWQGLKPVARFLNITLLCYAAVLIYMALISKEYRVSFILPIGEAGLVPILSSIKTSFFAYIGLELIVFFFPEVTDKKKMLKWQMLASFFSMIFFLIIVIACTTLFGENLLKILTIPLFNIARVYHAPVLERMDLYIISFWFIAMACSIRSYTFAAYYSIHKIFNFKKNKIYHVLFFIVVISFGLLLKDINEVFNFLGVINIAGLSVIGFLVLCLCISFVRKKGVKNL